MKIEYKKNTRKIIEGLVWIAKNKPGIDHYHVVKTCYVADKLHLNRYGRPIFGDVYIAMEYGPVPSYILDLININRKILNKIEIDDVYSSLEISQSGNKRVIFPKRDADIEFFSGTDIECLEAAINNVSEMSFDELANMTHQEKSWHNAWNKRRRADAKSEMMYIEEIIDDDNENRQEIIQYIRETSKTLVL